MLRCCIRWGTMETDELKQRVDLAAVIEDELGPPRRAGRWLKWRCPFHQDHTPSFAVGPDRDRYKCFACDATGDVFDWFMQRDNVSFVEAKRRVMELAGVAVLEHSRRPAEPARVAGGSVEPIAPDPPCDQWQSMAWDFVVRAQARLWDSEDGQGVALPYLQDRGLGEATIRTAGLGWCPGAAMAGAVWGIEGRMYLYRGIVIPLVYGADVWGVKIRWFVGEQPRTEGGQKYRHLKGGGDVWPYGLQKQSRRAGLLVCEGEFDQMLAQQEIAGVDVVAMKKPRPYWLPLLMNYREILAAYDRDTAGDSFGEGLCEVLPHVCLVTVPVQEDKADVTEFHRRGGDLAAWFAVQRRRCS